MLRKDLMQKYNLANSKLEGILNRQIFKSPQEYFIKSRYEMLIRTNDKAEDGINKILEARENAFENKVATLDALSPLKSLSRGFAAVKSQKGAIKSVKELTKGDTLSITFCDGSANCTVDSITEETYVK